MTKPEEDALVQALKAHLEDKKAVDIVVLDLRERATFTDFFVVATGTSHTHVAALAEEADRFFHTRSLRVLSVAGLPEATWALVDGGDIVVHLFQREARAFYDLEKLWAPLPVRSDQTAPAVKVDKADKVKRPPRTVRPAKPAKVAKPGKTRRP
ncbi:MAG: ribosome silencing factor [Magnetococcus sp. DMHC-8]